MFLISTVDWLFRLVNLVHSVYLLLSDLIRTEGQAGPELWLFFFGHDIGQRVEKMSEMEHLKQSEASLPLLHTDLKHPTNWKHPEKYLQVTDVIKTSPPNRNAKFPHG